MRKYIDIIEKADDFGTTPVLYHGTSLDNAMSILISGAIIAGHEGEGDDGPEGVSLSRSLATARQHAISRNRDMEDNFFDYFELGQPSIHKGAIFEFSREALADNLVHYADVSLEEHEERYLGNVPLIHMVGFYADRAELEKFKDLVALAIRTNDEADSLYGKPEYREALDWMINNSRPLS